MGTSKSSPGSPPNVPMVPPWTPDPPSDPPPDSPPDDDGDGTPDLPDPDQAAPPLSPSPPVPIAPPARFGTARTSLGKFMRTGSGSDMRKGIANYVGKGLGGTKTATRRFGGTASTAGALYGALSALAAGQPAATGSPLDPVLLSGRSADEVTSAVIEAVRPVDGTQDTEATRNAIHNALSELLAKKADADPLNLAEEDRLFVIERFLAFDIYNRLMLDLGKAIQDKAPSISAELARVREIKNYVKQTVSAEFRKLQKEGQTLNSQRIAAIARQAIQDALDVFQGGA